MEVEYSNFKLYVWCINILIHYINMISINNLEFSYNRNIGLFKDLNLKLEKGKIYGLLGKNGTGKSTLLRLVCGMLKPKAGTVLVNDKPSISRDVELLQRVYLQQEENYLPSISLSEYVSAYRDFYPKFDQEKLESSMQIFEVPMDSKLNEISFGQRKKFFLSFGMATNVDYLLLDEPTNSLDVPSRSQFRKVLTAGFHESQAIIISTHNMFDFGRLFDTIIILDDGQVVFNQDIEAIEQKLSFIKSNTIDDESVVLHKDTRYGEHLSIIPNSDDEPTSVDLEVLFKAVINNSTAINSQFKN